MKQWIRYTMAAMIAAAVTAGGGVLPQVPAGTAVYAAQAQNAWDGTADTSWFDEEIKQFTLSTPAELAGLAELVNAGRTMEGIVIRLGADLDFGGSADLQWPGIGTGTGAQFCGALVGGGHTISGLYQAGDVQTAGLVGVLGKSGSVRGLYMQSCRILSERTDTSSFSGTVAAYTMEGAAVWGCTADGCTVSGGYFAGGICGHAGGDLYDCTATGVRVTGPAYAGGIAGSAKPAVSGCTAMGMVTSESTERFVGGIIGTAEGSILRCTSQCVVTGGQYTGGIVGYTIADVSGCRNFGPVTTSAAQAMTGGIVGVQKSGTVKNCTNYAGVTAGGDLSGVGGIVGYAQGAVKGCLNRAGGVGVKYTGGIAGYTTDSSSISQCVNEASLGTASGLAGEHYVGGIAGDSRGSIDNCRNTADLELSVSKAPADGEDLRIGGVAGMASGSVSRCTQTGSVSAVSPEGTGLYARIGGIAGVVNEGCSLTDCCTTGGITAQGFAGGLHAGGIAGICLSSPEVTHVYSVGDLDVTGAEKTCVCGGIIGAVYTDAAPVLTGAYYRNVTADHGIGNAPDGGGVAKSETNMRTAEFAAALGDAFTQDGEDTYPVLAWEVYPDLDLDAAPGVKDVVLLEKYVGGHATLSGYQFMQADLNGDGAVNVIDLTMYKQMLTAE